MRQCEIKSLCPSLTKEDSPELIPLFDKEGMGRFFLIRELPTWIRTVPAVALSLDQAKITS